MSIVIDVVVGELAATRFAISPLAETVSALQLIGFGVRPAELLPWLSFAAGQVRSGRLTMPVAWPLIVPRGSSFPEFLTPSPAVADPTIADELEQLRRTTPAQVRTSLGRVFGDVLPDGVRQVADRPTSSLRAIADELAAAHDLLVAPYWPRLRAVAVADIAYRTRRLAAGGFGQLFADLSPQIHWDGRALIVDRAEPDRHVALGSRGLVLVPTVLIDGSVRVKGHSSTQIALRYPARGRAAPWSATEPARPAANAVRLLGRPRARLLELLRVPHGTTELAGLCGTTAGAVSQHLTVLRANGLIDTTRSGRTALHVLTMMGAQLLAAGPD